VHYCLALEYARHGDLRGFLHRSPAGWARVSVRRPGRERKPA